jgi:hypothetical protein
MSLTTLFRHKCSEPVAICFPTRRFRKPIEHQTKGSPSALGNERLAQSAPARLKCWLLIDCHSPLLLGLRVFAAINLSEREIVPRLIACQASINTRKVTRFIVVNHGPICYHRLVEQSHFMSDDAPAEL